MYLGCKIYPNSLMMAQPIYLSTGVVFALYSIRGYRITTGLFLGSMLAYYFSSRTLLSSFIQTVQILLCAFLLRYLLDKLHMALVSMRNLKEIIAFFILSIFIPQLIFIQSTITALGHTLGLLTIATIFLVWDAYVPKISPPKQSRRFLILTYFIWSIIGSVTYLFCQQLYYSKIFAFCLSYISLLLILIILLAKISNRFFHAIGLGFLGLPLLFYALLHPESILKNELVTAYIQISIIFVSGYWLAILSKLK